MACSARMLSKILNNVHDVLDATEFCVFFLHDTLEKTIDGA